MCICVYKEIYYKKSVHVLLQEQGSLLALERGLLSNTQKLIVRGDTYADEVRDFNGKGTWAERSRVREPGRTAQPRVLHDDGLVSRLSLTSHSDSESFLVVRVLLSQDGCQWEGFWEVVGHVVSPFDLSWALSVAGGLLVPYSLSGPPVVKQLMQTVTMVSGQGGWFQSVCFP